MLVQKITLALFGLFALLPLHAEQAVTTEAVTNDVEQDAGGSLIEQRIREYREFIEKRKQAVSAQDSRRSDAAGVPGDEVTGQRFEAANTRHQQRIAAMRKQQEERAAQAEKWREMRDKHNEARLETWLKQREEQQQRAIQRHESMRNRAEEEHNYLVQNHDAMLQKMLQEKIEVANHHEGLRKEADQRRKEYAALRASLKDMTPAERSEYMEKHREEIYGQDNASRQRRVPEQYRFTDMHRSPPSPWMRQEMPPMMRQ